MAAPVVRVRFAPSPTGPLHVGSVRTALLNWLFAHSSAVAGGRVLLRIDDTDRERSTPEFEQAIIDDLRWLNLVWDEGPVRQSDRAARYAEALAELPTVDRDGAFEFGGRVIARAGGGALYNLAAAVDDIDDSITHVLRGRDHLANTQLQLEIIRALGAEPPVYVHAPLLTGADGSKLSKREDRAVGAPSLTVAALRDAGFLPGAIANALALSLADFGTDEVMLTLDEIAGRFELDNLHTADSRFDLDKLRWISGQHIRALSDDALAAELGEWVDLPLPSAALAAARTGGATLAECAQVAGSLIEPPEPDTAARELLDTDETAAAIELLVRLMPAPPATITEAEEIFGALKLALREREIKLGPALHGLRAALTGRVDGPEFPYVLATLSPGRLARLGDRA
ncbi:MAG: glutamate--tRNA ligase family protein [Solirubrobacterales bacterium]